MNELLYIPQDHKNIIYSCLDIKSLIRIGSTCKTLHNEKNRILTLIQKVVDTYFYYSSTYTGMIRNWSIFPYEKLFYEMYIQKIKKISFDDLEIVKDPKTNDIRSVIVYNRTLPIENINSNLHIEIFMDAILTLPSYQKKQIYQTLFTYVRQLFSSDNSNLKRLGIHFHQSLSNLFRYENDYSMRKFMIFEVDKIIEVVEKKACGNRYTLNDFITYEDMNEFVEISDILVSLDRKREFKLLFDEFMANMKAKVSIYDIKNTYYQFKMPYRWIRGITYETKLCEMLKNIELLEEFQLWMNEIEDIIKSQ